jgi:hypothetical protein
VAPGPRLRLLPRRAPAEARGAGSPGTTSLCRRPGGPWVSPKRGERATSPAVGAEDELRFATTEAASGWATDQARGTDLIQVRVTTSDTCLAAEPRRGSPADTLRFDFLPLLKGGGFPSALRPIRLRPGASRRGVPVSQPTAEGETLAV